MPPPEAQAQSAAPTQPEQQPHVARDAALAAVAATALPASAAPAALTVTQIAQMSTGLLGALRKFQLRREAGFQDDLQREANRQAPNLADVAINLIGRELGYEASFRTKQTDRVTNQLQNALALPTKEERDAKVKQIFDQEKRFTDLREAAMRERVLAGLHHYGLERKSPDGAFWQLGVANTHTPDCVAMSDHHWPWEVLHEFQPPVHPGCQCKLISTQEAIHKGLMSPDAIGDPADAYSDAMIRLRVAAQALKEGVGKIDLREAYVLRWGKGVAHGGEFRPKVGGDPGASLLRKMGLLGRGQRHDPLKASDGRWARLGGTSVRIPHAEWRKSINGVAYHSPEGSTNVYRDGQLLSPPSVNSEDVERVHQIAGETRNALRSEAARRRGGVRNGSPLRKGDGPSALMGMEGRGYGMVDARPHGAGLWSVSYANDMKGDRVHAVISPRGVKAASWDPTPIDAVSASTSLGPPMSFKAHTRDMKAWGHELADRYGSGLRLRRIHPDGNLMDHAGFRDFRGNISLGSDVEPDIENAAAARAAGRPLTDLEKRGVYASMWASAHELSHSVNPIKARDAKGEDVILEEVLAEEMSHQLARERLGQQGQGDVLEWLRQNPTDLAVRGVYLHHRGALADLFDRAGLSQSQRAELVEDLKFRVKPRDRFKVLGRLLRDQNPELSGRKAERAARELMRSERQAPRSVLQSPGVPAKFKGAYQDIAKKVAHTKLPIKEPTSVTSPEDWKPEPKVIGGDVPEPSQQGVIPSYRHVPLELVGHKDFGTGAQKAKDAEGNDWMVQSHNSDQDHVASELLSSAVYNALGIPTANPGVIQTEPEPDFATVPDQNIDEPELPPSGRVSAGVILRDGNGKLTIVSPRNGFGGYVNTFSKGGMEKGMTAQQTALKELWEETGLHGHITGYVGDFKGTTGTTRFYLGVKTGGTPTVNDEVEAIHTVTPKIAAEMLHHDRDQKVLAAVLSQPVPKGKFKDEFPEQKPGIGLAFRKPKGKVRDLKKPSDAFARGYMADALLGNWDPVGDYGKNLVWDGDQNPIRVGQHATLEFDRHGRPKPFDGVPSEAWTLMRRGQANGRVDLSDEELRDQAGYVANEMTLDKINSLVDAAPFKDEAMRDRVRQSLIDRVRWMRDFADGLEDLPEPVSGDAATGLMKDSAFELYPEEEQALSQFFGSSRDKVDELLRQNKSGDKPEVNLINTLDSAIDATEVPDDLFTWVRLPEGDVAKLNGKTVQQKSFTAVTTDPAVVGDAPRMRLMIPGGARALYVGDQPSNVLLPRGSRLRIDKVDGDVAYATLMPYQRPSKAYEKSKWAYQQSALPSKGSKPWQTTTPKPKVTPKKAKQLSLGGTHDFEIGDRVRFKSGTKAHVVTGTDPLTVKPDDSPFKMPVKADSIVKID